MKRKGIDVYQILMFMAVMLGIFMFIWYGQTIQAEDMDFNDEPTYVIDRPWRVQVNDGPEELVYLPFKVEAKHGDKVAYRTVLEEQPTLCNSILFHSAHQYVTVLLDDEVLLTYGKNQSTPVPMSPGSVWQYVRLPNDWVGRELTIEMVGFYDYKSGFLESVYLGTKAALLYEMVGLAWPSLILIVPILVLGIAMLLSSFYFKVAGVRQKIFYLGVFTICTSIWILLESRVVQLLGVHVLLAMNLIFILFGLLPVFLHYYILSYPIFNKSKYLRFVFLLTIINYVAIQLLRFTGRVDYMDTVPLVHWVIVLQIAGILFIFFREKWRKHKLDEESKLLFVAILVFACFCVVDILRFYSPMTTMAIQFSKVGLFCFVLILGYSVVRQGAGEQVKHIEQQTLERLAYTDTLTGMSNRTAFEKQVSQYRQGDCHHPLIVMMADMNGLKWINDHGGHRAGDEAIICMANLLDKYFSMLGQCYRIGGDEFCVLAENMDETSFQQQIDNSMAELDQQRVDGYPLSMACGFVLCKPEEIDRALVEADEKMYAHKAQQKSRQSNPR